MSKNRTRQLSSLPFGLLLSFISSILISFSFATSATSTKPQKCKGWTSCPRCFFPPTFFPLFLLFPFLSWDRQFLLVAPRPMVSFVHIWWPWTSTFHSSFTPSCICAIASRPPLSSVEKQAQGAVQLSVFPCACWSL